MLSIFRLSSVCEGISFLIILGVSLGFVPREFVYPIGMAHGVLFMAYMVLSLLVSNKQGWSVMVWLFIFLASIVPFAFIAVEMFIQREIKKQPMLT